jgi:hypothetical protein
VCHIYRIRDTLSSRSREISELKFQFSKNNENQHLNLVFSHGCDSNKYSLCSDNIVDGRIVLMAIILSEPGE